MLVMVATNGRFANWVLKRGGNALNEEAIGNFAEGLVGIAWAAIRKDLGSEWQQMPYDGWTPAIGEVAMTPTAEKVFRELAYLLFWCQIMLVVPWL